MSNHKREKNPLYEYQLDLTDQKNLFSIPRENLQDDLYVFLKKDPLLVQGLLKWVKGMTL